MAGRILKDDIETLRRQADIVVVAGDYTTLRRAGKSFKGLCPFHTERTPSFTVAQDNNVYHCFGCGASGDIYDFLMRIEGLEFPEAVESLARRVGFTLRYEELSARERQRVGERSRLVDVTRAACEFFRARLLGDEGEPARRYLRERGFGRDDADRFELGFAPNAWSALADDLSASGHALDDLVTVGLVVRGDGGRVRDRFRGRLIFPIEDASGDVIGFGGRVVPGLDYGDFDPPKYLNSPETPLYHKSRVLYGLRAARSEIVRTDTVLVCEGYTDVLALHQAGMTNAVATCGTAVGDEHLRSVARYARRVVLAFDADDAGVKAAERAWEAARSHHAHGGGLLDLRVLALADGADPADLVRQHGPDDLRHLVERAEPVVPYVVAHRLRDADLATEGGRTDALRAALDVVGREPDLDLRRDWARSQIAERIGISYDFVARTAERMGIELDAHEGVATNPERATPSAPSRPERTRAARERSVLRIAVQHPELLPEEWFELTEEHFTHPRARAVWRALDAAGGVGVDLAVVLDHAHDDDDRALIRALSLEDDALVGDDREVVRDVAQEQVRRVLADQLETQERALRDELTSLHHARDAERVRDLQQRLLELQRRRRELVAVLG